MGKRAAQHSSARLPTFQYYLKMLVKNTLLVVMLVPATLSLVPTRMFPTCLTSPLDLIPDPEDCHIFYQCDLNPQPMSCGNMMFNSFRQVCDWPSTVLQLRPECRQEEQFRFSSQEYPYHRTLRMLNFFGDGNQFSQKRLRAPQDVGLGRQKNFGNRDYSGEDVSNHVETDTFDNYEDEKMNKISNDLGSDIKNQILEEIRRRLPQIVKNSIPHLVTKQDTHSRVIATKQDNHAHAVSTPADTIRLTLQQTPISPALQTARVTLTPYNELQQDSPYVAKTQGQTNLNVVHKNLSDHNKSNNHSKHKQPQAVSTPADTIRLQAQKVSYEQVYPVQAAPAIAPAPALIPLYTQSDLPNQNQPQLAPILVEDTREFKPVWTVTREKPRQILLKYWNRKPNQQTLCADKNCPKQRQRVLKKIKRKLITGEKHQLEERRKEFIQGTKAAQNSINYLEEDIAEELNTDERNAITLKEAYDRAIRKVEQSQNQRPVAGNLLHEILNRDFGSKSIINYGEYNSQSYVNSDDLRSEIPSEFDE